jgi:hypothetical protein
MSRFRRPQGLTIWPKLMAKLLAWSLAMLLALLWTAGCARPAGPQSDDAVVHADQHQAPFHEGESTASAPQASPTAQDTGSNPDTGLPFHGLQNHDPTNLPAGTLLGRKNSISAENPGANGTFEAVVDEPVVIEGNKLVPRGAAVLGRVESARAFKRNRGYVPGSQLYPPRRDEPAHKPRASTVMIRLEKGRRLTFRLTEPAYTPVDH